jgi:hypothetical protein
MRFIAILFAFMLSGTGSYAQPGKYAGSKKSLIGKEFADMAKLPALKGWKYMEGAIVNSNPNADVEMHSVSIFKAGTAYLIIFSINEDTAQDTYKIMDVVQVAGVAKGWTVRSASCRRDKENDAYIVAWGKETTAEYMKLIKKAWRINPDKRRIEIIPVKNIDCENIGC